MNFDELSKKHPDVEILLCNLLAKKYGGIMNPNNPEEDKFIELARKNLRFELKINGIEFNFIDLVEDLTKQMKEVNQDIVKNAVIEQLGNVSKLFNPIDNDNDFQDKIRKLKHSYLTLIIEEIQKRTKLIGKDDAFIDNFWDEATKIVG
jgi:hypothetical protein